MNAPAKEKALAPQSAFQMIAVDDIDPSHTHIQQLRRARFDPAAMAELVKSVTTQGVLQPIVVRRNPELDHGPNCGLWEIVAGERRWLAARTAKLGFIAAVCRELTDLQVLEIQLVENLQREGLHPLEEAEGFADLMQLKGVNAEAIAETIGRSRSHVFGRLKLLDLIQPAREAFNAGRIDASKAQLIARIPLPKLQQKALEAAQKLDWRNEPLSFRDFKSWLDRNQFTVALEGATFRQNDAKLLPAAGSCGDCPKRTGNLGDLFNDVKDPNVCTDPQCFDKKTAAEQKRRRAEAEAIGRTVLAGEAAAAVKDYRGLIGYIDLDEESDEDFAEPEPGNQPEDGLITPEYRAWQEREDAFRPRTYRQVIGDALDAKQVVLLDDGKKLREIVPVPVAKNLLKHHGMTLPAYLSQKPAPAADPAEHRAEEEKLRERQAREMAFRRALLVQIHAKWKPPLKRDDLVAFAEGALCEHGAGDALEELCYGNKQIVLADMSDGDIMRLLAELAIGECVDFIHQSPAPLLAMAKRCKIDPAKVKKDLAKAEKAKDKPAAAAKAPAAKKQVKKKAVKK